MSRIIILFILSFPWACHLAHAQGEENLWFFGEGYVVDFSSGVPQLCPSPPQHTTAFTFTPGYYSARFGVQAGICTPAGALRFLVHIRSNASNAQQYRRAPKVFDATGYSMPNGDINAALTGGEGSAVAPLILPWPDDPDKYFVIYSINAGLLYSVVNMQLNNGLGDIDTAHKDILLSGYGTIIGAKYAAVQGCGEIWLVVRSRIENQYLSFRITRRGIDPDPVISACGLLPSITDYEEPIYSGGRLAVSPNGKTLAAATNRGIELYDFERCSGRVSNPRVIDTFTFLGLCFSPDNNLLYASSLENDFTTMENYYLYGHQKYPGRVYQYDLGQGTVSAIANSRVLIFENPRVACATPLRCNCGSCNCDTFASDLGDLKRAPDGKIYFASNYRSCGTPIARFPPLPAPPLAPMPFPMPAIVYDSSALHVIHEPNRLGWACRPEPNVLMLKHHGKPYRHLETGMWLPLPIVVPPSDPDTIPGTYTTLAACFTDSLVLTAPEGRCYIWDDQSTQPTRTVHRSGTYTIGLFNDDCTYRTDTFRVVFTTLPQTGPASYSCINKPEGVLYIAQNDTDTSAFRYTWSDQQGSILHTNTGRHGDTLHGLHPGTYTVRINTTLGCDTSLTMEVLSLPHPVASFDADILVCKGDTVRLHYTAQAPSWIWSLGDGTMHTKERSPIHNYLETGIYTVMLVTENPERCTDTAIKQIHVKDLQLKLIADKTRVSRGAQSYLQSAAPEPYQVIAWLPEDHFADQQAYQQTVTADTTLTYHVIARSGYGCLDTASVQIEVHPVILIPTAFSPNGDGRNDLFRPSVSGGPVTIRTFMIFDRWGRLVWDQQQSPSTNGWDGNYNNKPAEVGVYFYQIEIDTHTGQTIQKHGDLTLIR